MSYIFETFQQRYSNEELKNIFNVTSSQPHEMQGRCDNLPYGSPYCLIYKDPDCMWHSKTYEYGWLIFGNFYKIMTITGYRIFSSTCCRLRNHYLKGSNNGVDWTEIVHITSNTPHDNLGRWVDYNVSESSFRMYKIEEEASALGNGGGCAINKHFGLLKVDFISTKISELLVINSIMKLKKTPLIGISILFVFIYNIVFSN